MKHYTDNELLTLRLKYKDNHEILELIDTVDELLEDNGYNFNSVLLDENDAESE